MKVRDFGWDIGTVATCQLAPKREERGGRRKAMEERSLLVLSLVYDQASELSRNIYEWMSEVSA